MPISRSRYRVSIVIPNYNGVQLLERNLPKVVIAANAYLAETEIIVVDDGSSDASISIIENAKLKYKNLKLIRHEKNKGFASSVNMGVAVASGEIAVLLNTDVTPEPDFLESLLANFADETVFAVGCLDRSIEGDNVIERGRGEAFWRRGLLIHRRGEVNKKDTFWVSGGSGAFRKKIWDILGGMDELYSPYYWEDIDISYRAQKAGYKVLFEPKSIVVHRHEDGSVKKNYSSLDTTKIAYRNQFIFIWKNITDPKLVLSHVFWFFLHLMRHAILLDLAYYLGLALALGRLKLIIEARLSAKRTARLSDSQLMHYS